MARVREYLSLDEQVKIAKLFYEYPSRKLMEYLQDEESFIEERHLYYLPYLESVLYSSLYKAIESYNKSTEYSRSRRSIYFKKYVDEIMDNDIKEVTLNINAAIARVEGSASRSPLKADRELYDLLLKVKEGQSLLDIELDKDEE